MQDIAQKDRSLLFKLHEKIYLFLRHTMSVKEVAELARIVRQNDKIFESKESLSQLMFSLNTAVIAMDEIGLKQPTVCSILLFDALLSNNISLQDVEDSFGQEIKIILSGLQKVHELDSKRSDNKSNNY